MDMAIEDDDVASDPGLQTATLLSVMPHRRADDNDQVDGEDRGGWWADELLYAPGDGIGNRAWLLARTKITEDLIPRAEEYDREALDWMIEDLVASSVDVAAELRVGAIDLARAIDIHRPQQDPTSFRFDHAWDGEAARGA
jgi:phage gp46-like protein